MNISAQNIYDLYVPDECEKRLYLRFKREKETEPDPFQEVLRDIGRQREKDYLKTLCPCVDLSAMPFEERIARTKQLIANKTPLIYHGVFQITNDKNDTVTGIPDFLILSGDSYIIRDSKLARKVDEKEGHHVEIILQLQLYGYLFEKTLGEPPTGLEVVLGTGEIVPIVYDKGESIRPILGNILRIISKPEVPYAPVGWSRCNGCGYRPLCWDPAVAEKNVATVTDVDKGTATGLHVDGVDTVDQLLAKYDEKKLSLLERPWGQGFQKVGKKAEKIIRNVKVIKSGKHLWLEKLMLPVSENYVMFDLEGMPPYLDEIESIYLWGMKIYGKKPSTYLRAVADISDNGDRQGWEEFLNTSTKIFDDYGDIPFVHYSPYEKTKLDLYLKRYGDKDGIAERVRSNLFDLLPAVKKSVILAAPSYSLKVIEQIAGFKRSQDEYGGSWSMAQYIKAVETKDVTEREKLMSAILIYNEEDLKAMWEVMQWFIKFDEKKASNV
jgi:uncharacterized protein